MSRIAWKEGFDQERRRKWEGYLPGGPSVVITVQEREGGAYVKCPGHKDIPKWQRLVRSSDLGKRLGERMIEGRKGRKDVDEEYRTLLQEEDE